jgi:uncharacterized lipoprotein NlpE involved in copper resistance
MKNAFFRALLLVGLLAGGAACENTADPAPQSELLSGSGSKTWKVISIKKDGSDRFQGSCQADNLYIFHAGSSFEMDEGAKKCSTTDPQKLAGTWSLSNSVITVKQGSRSFLQMDVKALTASRLVVTNQVGGETVETTFQAQ